ncbi:transposase [Arsenophonus endosymbiont of Bemisia tabaci]|uniref:transposase n=1 Tax=Arsenophonus endosymbiont of Bemisia tabaci TaxID=536059 RepID=UPI00176D2FC5|nr:transposase [Arsenophonus endosymbiont of Bemisia tabaci]CAA2929445.1 hypothetical protein ARSQ2_00537 [Arsenophonus endosymbiont of Bemisia tabaci Q2]
MVEYFPTYSRDLNPIEHKWAQAKCRARMRHRYFVRTQYGVIKIKSLSYKEAETIDPFAALLSKK